MGAMATLMYLIYSRLQGRDHGVSAAVLLSPAGYHKTVQTDTSPTTQRHLLTFPPIQAPLVVYIMGPLINFFLRFFPGLVHSFHHPSGTCNIAISTWILM